MERTRDEARLAGALVAAQAVLLAALAVPARGRPARPYRWLGLGLLGAGGLVAAAGGRALGPALTPSPLPRDGAALRTEGLYARVRHPIYSGLLVASWGRAMASGAPRHAAAAAALTVLLRVKSGYEERHLRRAFSAYDDYAATTPRLVPALPRWDVSR